MELYDRQKGLDLKRFDKVLVVGAGGIGSWVALDLALSGCVGMLAVCDPDHLEESNLNRTPFRKDQIGENKAWAVKDLVDERRDGANVVPITEVLQNAGKLVSGYRNVIDCTDGLVVKEWARSRELDLYIKLGYDGFSCTIDGTRAIPWGESRGYAIVPSFIAAPQFIASCVVGMLLGNVDINDAITFDMRDVLGIVQAHDDIEELRAELELTGLDGPV